MCCRRTPGIPKGCRMKLGELSSQLRQAGGPREGNSLGKCVGEFERVLLFRRVGGAGRERAGARV